MTAATNTAGITVLGDQFYDLHEDPHELVNLAMDRNRRAEIREWYERLREAEIEEFVSLQGKA